MSLDIRTPPESSGWYKKDISCIIEFLETFRRKVQQEFENYEKKITTLENSISEEETTLDALTDTVTELREQLETITGADVTDE